MKILVTGAGGFIGSALVQKMVDSGQHKITAIFRRMSVDFPTNVDSVQICDFATNVDLTGVLAGVDVVIHAAARAHILNDSTVDPLSEYRKINTEATQSLARQAAKAGVSRFVFISSIGVNGNFSARPFSASDICNPDEFYAVSKYEAELGLQQIADESGLDVVIIRPPLVYGPNAPGNFQSMMRWLDKGIPLPLGAIHNKRSLVALDNLVDLIVTCIDHPAAANQIFLAGDGEDLSTTELLQRMAKAMGKPARLIPVPTKVLELGATLLGKRAMAQRLCGSLQVDISKARDVLDWMPPISVDEGLRKAAAGFKQSL